MTDGQELGEPIEGDRQVVPVRIRGGFARMHRHPHPHRSKGIVPGLFEQRPLRRHRGPQRVCGGGEGRLHCIPDDCEDDAVVGGDEALEDSQLPRYRLPRRGPIPLPERGAAYAATLANHEPPLDVWDRTRLAPVAERTRRPELREKQIVLTSSAAPMRFQLNGAKELAIGIVDASQLVALPGIEDLSLFNRNVRLGLDRRTRINREIGDTVQQIEEHPLFPAYHNGLTMLTYGLEVKGNELHLDGLTVVNGCQSLLTLHDNRPSLSPELNVLVKVVEVDRHSDLSDTITYRTNNQNPVDIRDQRSTDPIQRDLQALMRDSYGAQLSYRIRAGERFTGEVLDNQTAVSALSWSCSTMRPALR
jgi:AIPR protein